MPQFLPHDAATTGDPNFSNADTFNTDLSTPPTDEQLLQFDAASNTWKPADASSGGATRARRDQVNIQSVTQIGVTNAGCALSSTSSFSWTCPSDVTEIYVEIAGAGSGGETNAAQGGGGQGRGGGSGAYYQGWMTIVAGSSLAIVVGNAAGQRSGACGGTQRAGALTSITGMIEGSTAATLTCNGGTGGGVFAGDVATTGFSGDTPQTRGDLPQDNPHFHINTRLWNTDQWRGNGDATTNGGRGGENYRAATGGAGTAGGGGGSGFNSGSAGSTDGSGNSGGPGGIRITWYSANSTAANFPIS